MNLYNYNNIYKHEKDNNYIKLDVCRDGLFSD